MKRLGKAMALWRTDDPLDSVIAVVILLVTFGPLVYQIHKNRR